MHRSLRVLLLAASLAAPVFLGACGGATEVHHARPTLPTEVTGAVTDSNYGAALRAYAHLDAADERRDDLRTRLVAHLARQTDHILDRGNYDAVVDHFAAMTSLYSPTEIESGAIARELGPPAAWIAEHGSPLGDEGRVLAALQVLRVLHPERTELGEEYTDLAEWTRSSRAHLRGPADHYRTLVTAWREHARLAPTPQALSTAVDLYRERRDAWMALLRPESRQLPPSLFMEDFAEVQQQIMAAPLDVAAVYFLVGDMASARQRAEAIGGASPALSRALRAAASDGDESTEALVALAEFYKSEQMNRPDVAAALCRYGLARDHRSALLPLCLARLARDADHVADAMAWYGEAISLAPDEQQLYDESLEAMRVMLDDAEDVDPADVRAMATEADRILAARRARFPSAELPLGRDRLEVALGQAEQRAGNIDAARAHFEASLRAREEPFALLSLARLELLTGDATNASRLYRRALDLTPQRSRDEIEPRATILASYGDAMRASGDDVQARRMYQESLSLYDSRADSDDREVEAATQVQRGLLLDKLGRHADAVQAFRSAFDAVPSRLPAYIHVLSYLVAAEPDPDFAVELFRRAQRHIALEPEWKVYLALWVKAISARRGTATDADVDAVLRELSRGDAWWAKLARFGAGTISADELYAAASSRGEQTEALFYGGAGELGTPRAPHARELLERVVSMNMVSFYEYEMAKRLLAALPSTTTRGVQ